jgi:hypothetical protein
VFVLDLVTKGKILGSVTDEAYLLVLELGWADYPAFEIEMFLQRRNC